MDLVCRLTRAGVAYDELVVPDDTHHFLLHANPLLVNKATVAFFERVFGAGRGTTAAGPR